MRAAPLWDMGLALACERIDQRAQQIADKVAEARRKKKKKDGDDEDDEDSEE